MRGIINNSARWDHFMKGYLDVDGLKSMKRGNLGITVKRLILNPFTRELHPMIG